MSTFLKDILQRFESRNNDGHIVFAIIMIYDYKNKENVNSNLLIKSFPDYDEATTFVINNFGPTLQKIRGDISNYVVFRKEIRPIENREIHEYVQNLYLVFKCEEKGLLSLLNTDCVLLFQQEYEAETFKSVFEKKIKQTVIELL